MCPELPRRGRTSANIWTTKLIALSPRNAQFWFEMMAYHLREPRPVNTPNAVDYLFSPITGRAARTWSMGWDSNPRIVVLQTTDLAACRPMQIHRKPIPSRTHRLDFLDIDELCGFVVLIDLGASGRTRTCTGRCPPRFECGASACSTTKAQIFIRRRPPGSL